MQLQNSQSFKYPPQTHQQPPDLHPNRQSNLAVSTPQNRRMSSLKSKSNLIASAAHNPHTSATILQLVAASWAIVLYKVSDTSSSNKDQTRVYESVECTLPLAIVSVQQSARQLRRAAQLTPGDIDLPSH
jgi:hypothetical protein